MNNKFDSKVFKVFSLMPYDWQYMDKLLVLLIQKDMQDKLCGF